MASGRRKKAKIRAEEMEKEEVDRLSNLPEQLIHHILSFMDTKFAVQTCVLSTRWKSLWTSLPILIFNSNTFRKLPSFDKFVSHVLSGIQSRSAASGVRVSRFAFTRGGTISPALLEKVVQYVKSQRVQSLSISISYRQQPGFLTNIFRLKSLKHLKLTIDSDVEGLEVSFLNLPALTTLHLEGVSFSKLDSKLFVSDCLNLKKLALVCCYTFGLEVFNISLPQLESLTILSYPCIWESRKDNCKFVVSAPKLTSLNLKGFPYLQLCAQNIPSLEKVVLDIRYPYKSTNAFNQSAASQFINILAELGRAKSLKLSYNSIKILFACLDLLKHQPSPFSNLKFLKLHRLSTSIVPDHVMTYLVGSSPGVEVVIGKP